MQENKSPAKAGLGLPLAVDIADENGQGHGQDDVQHDEHQVVEDCIAEDLGEVAQAEHTTK